MRLRELIDEMGMKKTAFAQEAGVSVTYVHHAINGRKTSRAYAQRMVNAVNRKLGTAYTVDDLELNLG